MHVALYHHARLPIKGYGGTERVIVWLARGLAALGHRVTLLAAPGSRVPEAELVPVEPRLSRREDFDLTRFVPDDADLLHSFVPFRVAPGVPHLWTQEGNFRPGAVPPANTIYVSANHAERNGSRAFVYNGIDPAEYEFRTSKGDYDFFLGRLHRIKGYQLAMEAARQAGRRLVLAGGWRPSVRRGIRFVGEVDGEAKRDWLAGARCLWMPALWDEPFGLTLAEALMSGTPIIGTNRGSLPEIISPEVGGRGDTLEELVAIAGEIDRRDPEACRAHALRYFTHLVMAEEYVRYYRAFLADGVLPEGKRTEG